MDRSTTGRYGEDIACQYLIENGHIILARNWRDGREELDIVSLASDGIHFVEVKTRTAPAAAPPQDQVDLRKQRHLAAAARRFLRNRDGGTFADLEVFFDIVAVTLDGSSAGIDFFPAAFIPIYT